MKLIVNMHIRRDWQKWLIPTDSNKRITAVCGAKTSEKFAGIPAINHQPELYASGNTGWCIHCCGLALEICNGLDLSKTSYNIRSQYSSAMGVMIRQIELANEVMSTI